MPHRADRLRAGQEAALRDYDRVARADARAPRGDPARSVDRVGHAARRQRQSARARRRDAGTGAQGDADRLARVETMSEEEKVDVAPGPPMDEEREDDSSAYQL